ncbi:MAG: hypothetical protein ABMA64_26310 [Myxococcota bacterium]
MWWLAGCTDTSTRLTLHPEPDAAEVFTDFATFTGHPGLSVAVGEPVGRGRHVTLHTDPALGPGAYRVRREGRGWRVDGGDLLGQQFGAADVLESAGFRWVHPSYTRFPVELDPREDGWGDEVVPDVARNGLHLHTLHPIEGYYDLWEPSADGLDRARRVIDWVVKNRGNHLQWPMLDQVLRDSSSTGPWQEHTRAIVDYAHARGVTVGLGLQLFSGANVQHAFDLGAETPDAVTIDARLAAVAPVGADEYDLSFGEFFGEEPAAFLAAADLAVERMRAASPGVDVATTIHVDGDLRVTWQGEEMGYYFLAQFVDALPRVHTVMYYDLFEDAGGAYELDGFDEHRAFLLDALDAGEPVGYHPESAYWVAFDVSVPTYLPLYVRSRFVDLDQVAEHVAQTGGAPLQDHVLFSSGWEWGYWLNDVTTLRMAHHRPEQWGDAIREVYSGWGDPGQALASATIALAELQHDALMGQRLAAYLAGRDAVIDLGDDVLDIHSQPDRPQLDEVGALSADARAALAQVVVDLDAMADATDALYDEIEPLGVDDPVFDEARDGFAIDALRARFVARIYAGALSGDPTELAAADGLRAEAAEVVARRHARLWWPGGERILQMEDANATLYQSGYLSKADTLCFWDRERTQLSNLLGGGSEPVPPCT